MLHAGHDEWGRTVNSLILELRSATACEDVPNITSFVGADKTGSFGIMPGHTRFMTMLVFGLARFREIDGDWRYLALPGGLLYHDQSHLQITTRRYLIDDNYERISFLLDEQLRSEEQQLSTTKASLRRIEEEFFRRIWQLKHRMP